MKILKGDWVSESGLLERGELMVELVDGNKITDVHDGVQLIVERYAVCDGVTGVSITSPMGAWEFSPDQSELDRVGLTV